MMLGWHVSLPGDLVLGKAEPENSLNMSEYANKLTQTIERIHNFVRGKIEIASVKMLRECNSKINFSGYTEGDAVWYYAHNVSKLGSPKLQCHWVGPYTVIKRINEVIYKIKKAPWRPKVVRFTIIC